MAAIVDVEIGGPHAGGLRCVITHQGRSVVLYCGAVPLSSVAAAAALLLAISLRPGEAFRLLNEDGTFLEPTALLANDLTAELFIA